VLIAKYNWNDQIKEDDMCKECSTNGEKRNTYMLLTGKLERKKPLRRPKRRWVDNIKMNLRGIRWGGMQWSYLAQDKGQWRTLVNTVMNHRVP
jgi:hypothetical protein